MTRFLRQRVALLALPVLAGCADANEQAAQLPFPQDTYVDVMVELTRLRRLPPPARGEPERERLSDSIRADILARHGVTADQVVAFADVAGRDPTLMMGLSQAIAERSDSLQAALARGDSVRPSGTDSGRAPAAGRSGESRAGEVAADSVPEPRFADPADFAEPDRPADAARKVLPRPARGAIERPVKRPNSN